MTMFHVYRNGAKVTTVKEPYNWIAEDCRDSDFDPTEIGEDIAEKGEFNSGAFIYKVTNAKPRPTKVSKTDPNHGLGNVLREMITDTQRLDALEGMLFESKLLERIFILSSDEGTAVGPSIVRLETYNGNKRFSNVRDALSHLFARRVLTGKMSVDDKPRRKPVKASNPESNADTAPNQSKRR